MMYRVLNFPTGAGFVQHNDAYGMILRRMVFYETVSVVVRSNMKKKLNCHTNRTLQNLSSDSICFELALCSFSMTNIPSSTMALIVFCNVVQYRTLNLIIQEM